MREAMIVRWCDVLIERFLRIGSSPSSCRFGNRLLSSLVVSCLVVVALSTMTVDAARVKSVIYLIGDGMGFRQMEVARFAKGAPLVIDSMEMRSEARNASLDRAVTDSAAAGTAHATGFRTNNGMISMTPDGVLLRSIVYLAKKAGLRTGVVTNDALHGATPGAYVANAISRDDKEDILEQAIFETQPDVLVGGGQSVYNQIKAAERLPETGYRLVQTADQLREWDASSGEKLLGLFASGAMAYAVERPATEPSVAEMLQVALDALSGGENGFFLMLENDRIDGAGHANDLRRSVYDTLAFDEAVAVALAFAAERDDTLVIVTADHETGGLTPGRGVPSMVVLREGPEAVRLRIMDAFSQDPEADLVALLTQEAGIEDVEPMVFQGNLAGFIEALLTQQAGYFYTTTGHTDVPVPVFAQGPGAEHFLEVEHITDMAQTVIEILGLNREGDH